MRLSIDVWNQIMTKNINSIHTFSCRAAESINPDFTVTHCQVPTHCHLRPHSSRIFSLTTVKNNLSERAPTAHALQDSHHTDQASQDSAGSNNAPIHLRAGPCARGRPGTGRAGRRCRSRGGAPGQGCGACHVTADSLGDLSKASRDNDAAVRGCHRFRDGGAARAPGPAVSPVAPASPARVVAVAAGADPWASVPRASGYRDHAGRIARCPAAPTTARAALASEPTAAAGAAPAFAVASAWAPAARGSGPGHGVHAGRTDAGTR